MNTNEVREICRQRLAGWTKKLVAEHATPVLLLGIGHDNHSGQIVICATEDTANSQILLFLQAAELGVKKLAEAEAAGVKKATFVERMPGGPEVAG